MGPTAFHILNLNKKGGINLPVNITLRYQRLQEELKGKNLDFALFMDRENIIYYTGLTDMECMALIIPVDKDPVAITMWLDVPLIREKCAIQDIRGYVFPASNLGASIVETISKMGYESPKVGVSKYFMEFSIYKALTDNFANIEFHDASSLTYKVRSIKDEEEIYRLKIASSFVLKGMKAAVDAVKPGLTEVEVLAEAEYAMRKAGSEGSTFRMQVLAGQRQLLTHPYAGNHKIKNNETVVIHLGATYEGYVSKMCRTVALGDVHPETKKIYEVMLGAQQASITAVKPGVPVREVYLAAYSIVEQAGYSKYFIDDIGHGVGIRQSEFYPVIGLNRDFSIEENMVIDLIFPTIFKREVGGARVTDTMLVTGSGVEIFTDFTRELIQK